VITRKLAAERGSNWRQPSTRCLLLSALVLALAVVPVATADNPVRRVNESQQDLTITGQCAFPVLAHVQGREILTTFTNRAGDEVRQLGVFPGNTLTLTNGNGGESLTLPATGSFQLRFHADGSATMMLTGHGPFVPNPITGEPGIWYLSGRIVATFDAEENMTSIDLTGSLENLCPRLA
jgi:hypothetical protein